MKQIAIWVVLAAIGLAAVENCGGGGASAAKRPPFAPNPTCNGVEPAGQIRAHLGGPNIWVPPTTVEQPGDIGRRAHTNHLLLASSMSGKRGIIGGLTPAQVAGAYSVGANGGAGAIAIIDSYNYPNALNDFNVFSTQFGLPTETSADVTASTNTALQVVYSNGKPADDAGWSEEMALDIEWAHAMAPQAKIYLVEAPSTNFTDLMAAVNIAKALPGVRQVSMSFGGTESACLDVAFDNVFQRNHVTFFAAAGDTAGERDYPALCKNVIAVGGTTLSVSLGGVWQGETVWSGTGCGPSASEPRPVFQDGVYSTIGLYRAGCDIAAVGDPNTGVAVYDSYPYQNTSGWLIFGGTSASCPIVAGIVNSSGVTINSSQALGAKFYLGIGDPHFHDISAGSSGAFSAASGWDFASGVGSPNGLGAFLGGQ